MTPDPAGAALLDDLAAHLRRFVVLDAHQTTALALWCVHTHTVDAAEITPYIAVTSAEKRSGKSTLLGILRGLVRDPLGAANASGPALYRAIEDRQPTLLFDEFDAMLGGSKERGEELRGILNTGFSRDGDPVLRCVPPTHAVAAFDVFCPKVIAGIGDLPDTLADRSIRVRLRRARPGERPARARARDVRPLADALRERVAAWTAELLDDLAAFRLENLDIDDRANDMWEPLVAIAEAAGGDWPTRAREAALNLAGERDAADASTGVRLLADIRFVFDEAGTDRMTSSGLCDALNAREESGWGGWNHGNGINPRDLARRLKEYDVIPGTVRVGAGTAKGYTRERFADAFARYLPPPADAGVTDDVTDCDGKCDGQNPVNHAGCDGVTANPGVRGGVGAGAPSDDDLERWAAMAEGARA